MKIIGLNYKKISIEKIKDIEAGVKINTHIGITDIQKRDLELFKSQDLAHFEYEFKINYEPGFASILFEGSLLVLIEDPQQAKNLFKEWKNKKIPEEIRKEILNLVLAKCNLKALQLEEDFNLPSHLPFPQIKL
jgi:hypothetical protein